jgi:hypothetical protein
MPSTASVVVVIIVVVPMATARLDNAPREQPTSKQQRDDRDEFDTHDFLTSIPMLVAIRGRIPALFQPLMLLPAPMLRPALTLPLAFTRLPTARTAPIPIPIGLLNGERLPDRRNRQGASRGWRHRSDYQQTKTRKAS